MGHRVDEGIRRWAAREAMAVLLLAVAAGWPPVAQAQDCSPASLRSELIRRAAVDQHARAQLLADPRSQEAHARVLQADQDNTAYMRSVLARCGWPRRSEVGDQAATAAWLLTQHADMDPQYQVIAGQQMKTAVHAGEASGEHLAVLVDRNRRLNDQPQVYGMQFARTPAATIRFYDIVNPADLDRRRKEIGLPSFHCWALEASATHGGVPIEWPAGVLVVPEACPDAP